MQGADVGVGPLEFEVVPANGIDRWNIMQVQAWGRGLQVHTHNYTHRVTCMHTIPTMGSKFRFIC